MKKIVLIGAGGHCKVIIDIIKSVDEYEIVGITDKVAKENILSIPIIGDDSILKKLYDEGVQYAFISIGAIRDMSIRNSIYKKLKDIGFIIPVLIHKTAIVSTYSYIEEGTCIMAGAIVNIGANVGKNCIINTGSIVDHDCKIAQNTHISPNVAIAGGVSIGFNTHIGIGSSVIQGIRIGNNVTVGAGAVVVNDVEDNSIVVGIPAKVVKVKK
ncbi:acetyltransferase [Clostridium sp. MSJ-4]|uniref:Acetyltransferase n=1 Tax=Clostridium simiarum TaxID=2841506 RepID=A0ABS6EXY8_9CLOT|nr:acetyltransferase [Clostridium simiarum]MBU5591091.1 acetyltransferase [Clostridium simiarum]